MLEVGKLLQQTVIESLELNSWQKRTLHALSRCRTAEMGGHIDRCDHTNCQKLHLSYNSCRNRHCPKCQGHQQSKWVEAREKELFNCSYYHVVFTLPAGLNQEALADPRWLYARLFKVAWSVIKDFGDNPKFLGGRTGMIAVLHTWGQNLSLHPHLHCIVPAGGLTKNHKWKSTLSKGKFLYPVKAMSKVYRSRMVAALRKEKQYDQSFYDKLFAKSWVIYAKRPFYGPTQVTEYLGRYTHKIAISNHRLQKWEAGRVSFGVKDYRKGGKKGVCCLSETEFIRRFALHILPKGFTRIRHYGILSSGKKQQARELVSAQIGEPTLKPSRPLLHRVCPSCKTGTLVTIYAFTSRGPPANWKTLFA